MNKFQKIAAQMAKDDLKKEKAKELGYNFREGKNGYYNCNRKAKLSIQGALEFKNHNKNLEW